jgi:hypothetical protein
MTLHLVKLAVGVENVGDFETWIARRLREARQRGEEPVYRHITRRMPKRAAELLEGGSLYWVVAGAIRARQRLLGLETREESGKSCCAIVLEPSLIPTRAKPHRPFQGWRYLPSEDAPRDAGGGGALTAIPPQLADELQKLGLI